MPSNNNRYSNTERRFYMNMTLMELAVVTLRLMEAGMSRGKAEELVHAVYMPGTDLGRLHIKITEILQGSGGK